MRRRVHPASTPRLSFPFLYPWHAAGDFPNLSEFPTLDTRGISNRPRWCHPDAKHQTAGSSTAQGDSRSESSPLPLGRKVCYDGSFKWGGLSFTNQELVLLFTEWDHTQSSLPYQRRLCEQLIGFDFG
jgi:hypothetical protein